MILFQTVVAMSRTGRNFVLAGGVLTLAACAPMQVMDDTTGSRLAQSPAGTPPQAPVDAGDIAIAGQEVAHSIMDLPVVANATVPPLVRFTGITSIVDKPIDTEPYTTLFRDRLLLITREKLRFVERTLPPLVTGKKSRKKEDEEQQPDQNITDPDYVILAELRGHVEDDTYRVQVQFIDAHTKDVLFNGLYSIAKEAALEPSAPEPPPSAESTPSSAPPSMPAGETPTTTSPRPRATGSPVL